MANTYTDLLKMRQPALGDTGWDDELNDNTAILEVLLAAMQKGNGVITGLAPTDGGSLDVDYTAGGVVVNGARKAVSASSKTCTANLKNWLYVDSSGAMQISTTAPTGQYVPIAMIDAGAASISRIADLRLLPRTPAVNVETLSADKTMAAGDICTRQILDPGGAARDVLLPPEAEGWLIVYNSADAAENLTLKDDSDADTIATVPQGGGAILLCDGTTWVKFENLKVAGDVVFDGSVSTGTLEATSQPYFSANISSEQSNVTGDGSAYNLTGAIWAENVDRGGDFSNGTFTAPSSRTYRFCGAVSLGGIVAAHTMYTLVLKTSNETVYLASGSAYGQSGDYSGTQYLIIPFANDSYMDAADTAYLQLTISNGTKVVDLRVYTRFCGYAIP